MIIDFSSYVPGMELLLKNTAKAPYPSGDAPNGRTTSQVMRFRVIPSSGPDESVIPATLAQIPRLGNPVVTRTMTLNELQGEEGPLSALLNGLAFSSPTTEKPTLGTTELWEIVNLTADTHPIHMHLVQFQLQDRQKFNARRYQVAFSEANPVIPSGTYVPVPVTPYLRGRPTPADPNESGWKDTYRMNPGEVTRILVRFAPQDGSPAFAFDADAAPGYIWHCHILEHEENDMMRRFELVAPGSGLIASHTIAAREPAPEEVRLFAPSPNPVTASAELGFRLPVAGHIDLDVYAVNGRRVRGLASRRFEAGEHFVSWPRVDDSGRPLRGGLYFVRLRGEGFSRTQKLIVAP